MFCNLGRLKSLFDSLTATYEEECKFGWIGYYWSTDLEGDIGIAGG